MKHEPLDQTNPANRCEVDGVKYVACKATFLCRECVGSGSSLCQALKGCTHKIWRPASEFERTEQIPVGTLSVIDGEMGPNPSVTLFPNLPIGEYELVAVRKAVKG